jgi:hypothetical protein
MIPADEVLTCAVCQWPVRIVRRRKLALEHVVGNRRHPVSLSRSQGSRVRVLPPGGFRGSPDGRNAVSRLGDGS